MHLTDTAAESLRLELGDDTEALLMRGEMPYEPNAERPMTFAFESYDWPLASVRPWLDFELPVGGRISGHLDLRIDDVASYGELEARVTPASLSLGGAAVAGSAAASGSVEPAASLLALSDVALDSMGGFLEWDAHRIRFQRLDLTSPSGVVNVTGTHDWTTGGLDLAMRSASLQLSEEPLKLYLPRPTLAVKSRSPVSSEASCTTRVWRWW